jgi:hypothetical protein
MRILSKAAVIIDKFGGVNDHSMSAFANGYQRNQI